jgi:hypothetical protein
MDLTIAVPDELASRLRAVEDRLPEILELGLREWLSTAPEYAGLSDVLQTLARLPSPEEVLALRPAIAVQERIEELLEKNRAGGLSSEEEKEWARYENVECICPSGQGSGDAAPGKGLTSPGSTAKPTA